jgi:hypothetical protein
MIDTAKRAAQVRAVLVDGWEAFDELTAELQRLTREEIHWRRRAEFAESELAAARERETQLREALTEARRHIMTLAGEGWDSVRRDIAGTSVTRIDAALASLPFEPPKNWQEL